MINGTGRKPNVFRLPGVSRGQSLIVTSIRKPHPASLWGGLLVQLPSMPCFGPHSASLLEASYGLHSAQDLGNIVLHRLSNLIAMNKGLSNANILFKYHHTVFKVLDSTTNQILLTYIILFSEANIFVYIIYSSSNFDIKQWHKDGHEK